MSQQQLARVVDVSERNVVRWETGRNQPRLEHLVRVAEACGVDLVDLFEDNGDSEDDEEPGGMAAILHEIRGLRRDLKTRAA